MKMKSATNFKTIHNLYLQQQQQQQKKTKKKKQKKNKKKKNKTICKTEKKYK